jgi:hypothetical protein
VSGSVGFVGPTVVPGSVVVSHRSLGGDAVPTPSDLVGRGDGDEVRDREDPVDTAVVTLV